MVFTCNISTLCYCYFCFRTRSEYFFHWLHTFNNNIIIIFTIWLRVMTIFKAYCTYHHPGPPHQTGSCHQTCLDLCTKREYFRCPASPLHVFMTAVHILAWRGQCSATHLCFGWMTCWCTVSCTRSWSCAGTRPPEDPSLSSPPSCTAAAGSSSVVYLGDPPGRVCGLPRKSAAEEPSQFPALATLNPATNANSGIYFTADESPPVLLTLCLFWWLVPVYPGGSDLRPAWSKLQSSFWPVVASHQASEDSLRAVYQSAPVNSK